MAWHYDGSIIETDEEIKEAIVEYKGWEEDNTLFSALEDYEREEILENIGYRKVYYDYEETLDNAFFTSKACDQHIKSNRHNLSSPVNYLSHAFRNPEMEGVMKFLVELSGGKPHK